MSEQEPQQTIYRIFCKELQLYKIFFNAIGYASRRRRYGGWRPGDRGCRGDANPNPFSYCVVTTVISSYANPFSCWMSIIAEEQSAIPALAAPCGQPWSKLGELWGWAWAVVLFIPLGSGWITSENGNVYVGEIGRIRLFSQADASAVDECPVLDNACFFWVVFTLRLSHVPTVASGAPGACQEQALQAIVDRASGQDIFVHRGDACLRVKNRYVSIAGRLSSRLLVA